MITKVDESYHATNRVSQDVLREIKKRREEKLTVSNDLSIYGITPPPPSAPPQQLNEFP